MNEIGRSKHSQPYWCIFVSALLIDVQLKEIFLYGKKELFSSMVIHGDFDPQPEIPERSQEWWGL